MSDHTTSEIGCTLCDLPIEGSEIIEDGNQFCCTDCVVTDSTRPLLSEDKRRTRLFQVNF